MSKTIWKVLFYVIGIAGVGFLKELRKEKNMTQEQLADKFFVSRRTVSRPDT